MTRRCLVAGQIVLIDQTVFSDSQFILPYVILFKFIEFSRAFGVSIAVFPDMQIYHDE